MAYHYTHPECLYRQKWYYVGRTLLLEVVMVGFARFLGLEVGTFYFWLYKLWDIQIRSSSASEQDKASPPQFRHSTAKLDPCEPPI
jgi:hypothetical protein